MPVTGVAICRSPACRTAREPGYADRGLCGYHESNGLKAISCLATDWADLWPSIWDKDASRHDTGRIDAAFGPSEPIDYGAEALACEIAVTAILWEVAVRDKAQLSDDDIDEWDIGPEALDRAVRILTAHWPVLIALGPMDYLDYHGKPARGDGIDGILTLAGLHRRAQNRLGYRKMTHAVAGTCGQCDRETLRHRDDQDEVYCATCDAAWPWDVYQDAVFGIPEVAA